MKRDLYMILLYPFILIAAMLMWVFYMGPCIIYQFVFKRDQLRKEGILKPKKP